MVRVQLEPAGTSTTYPFTSIERESSEPHGRSSNATRWVLNQAVFDAVNLDEIFGEGDTSSEPRARGTRSMMLPRMSANRDLVLFKSGDFCVECGFEICKRFGLLLLPLFDVLQPRAVGR